MTTHIAHLGNAELGGALGCALGCALAAMAAALGWWWFRARREREIADARNRVLEALVLDRDPAEILQGIVDFAAWVQPRVSLLLLDGDQQLRWTRAVGLPEFVREAHEEVRVDSDSLPAGVAAFTGEPCEVLGLTRDMHWATWWGQLAAHRLKACWAIPICGRDGTRLGALAVYASHERKPRPTERALLRDAAHLACLAIEHKRADERLRASETHLAEAQRIAHMGSWRGDPKARWVTCSEGMFEIFGWTADRRVTEEDIARAIHPEDLERLRREQASARADQTPLDTEYRIVRPDGSVRHLRERCTFGQDAQGHPAWAEGVVLDITEQKRGEEDRLKWERRLHQAQRLESLGLLAGGVAHDFNNLLLAIIGNAEMAKQALASTPAPRAFVEKIEQAAWRAAGLSQKMLAYAGRGRFVASAVDLNRVLRDMAAEIHGALARTTTLETDLAPELPLIQGDVGQLRQIVMSLVTNAAEAIGEHAGQVRLSTGVVRANRGLLDEALEVVRAGLDQPLPEGDYVWLEVSDTGCGMPPEVQKRIFDPFFTTKFTGRGLSLAAVLGMVRTHKGTIQVRSKAGQGTAMRILLPVAPAPLAASRTSAPAPVTPGASELAPGRPTILLVDDEETVRVVCQRLLEHLGCEVQAAPDGSSAVELFRQQPKRWDVVLLDLTMPGLSGDQVCRRLREIDPGVRVILYSGYNEPEASHRFADLGLSAFLQKPFTLSALEDKLREVLPSNRPLQAARASNPT